MLGLSEVKGLTIGRGVTGGDSRGVSTRGKDGLFRNSVRL